MSSDPSAEQTRSVTAGPVTVTKSFAADEFPVPAIKFVVESAASEPVNVRLVDSIPESFPMENVGFHPDFEKDNWTAYKSHRVEYDRTLDPGESTTTVYGIRLEGTDPGTFLTEPTVSLVDGTEADAADTAIDDVLGEDSNQLVRDVLSGERDSLPGLSAENGGGVDAPDLTADTSGGTETQSEDLALDLGDEGRADETDETDEKEDNHVDAPQPDAFDGSGTSATEHPTEAVVGAVDGDEKAAESQPVTEDDAGVDAPAEPTEDIELALDIDDAEPPGDERAEAERAEGERPPDSGRRVTAGSVLAALASEIEQEDADADDVAALRDALGVESETGSSVPRSVDLRIERLQSQVQDLAAYSGGLEAFLDEEGTAEELVEGFRADLESVTVELDELSSDLADAGDDREQLRDDVSDVRSTVSTFDGRLEGVDDRFDDTAEQLEAVDDRFDGLESRLDAVDDRFENVDDRFENADDRFDRLDERLDGLDSHLDAVDERFDALDSRLDEVADQTAQATETTERLDEEMGEVREELATVDEDITDVRQDVEAVRDDVDEGVAPVREDVSKLQDDLTELDDTVEEFRAFRDRLSNALGPMVGTGTAEATTDGEAAEDADGTGDEADADTGEEGEEADDGDADTEDET